MSWTVEFAVEFAEEFDQLDSAVQEQIVRGIRLLQQFGPALNRPNADTLIGSKHANMKELRFNAADGTWRVAFAFDPKRQAILLVAGDKSGISQKKFYRDLLRLADQRFDAHLKKE